MEYTGQIKCPANVYNKLTFAKLCSTILQLQPIQFGLDFLHVFLLTGTYNKENNIPVEYTAQISNKGIRQ